MTTVLAPLNQAVQPYVFRGGGANDNIKNVSPKSKLTLKNSSSAATKLLPEGGLEMIYEEKVQSPHSDAPYYSHTRQNCAFGNGNNVDPIQLQDPSLSPSPSILRRSRSLPQEEFRVLGAKLCLCELQRCDSIVSGKSGR